MAKTKKAVTLSDDDGEKLTVRLRPSDHGRFKEWCQERGTSMSVQVRVWIYGALHPEHRGLIGQ